MSDSQITIFYSWQSDLPGSETRNIIQDSIKDAVRLLRDTVDIEADRDTKGEFGSPDIAQTIFSKIDDCDIFVADVSAVCRYEATIGLIICKTKDNVVAEYSLEASSVPIGISEYQLSKVLPKEIESSLPSIEEIEKSLKAITGE